MSAAVCQAHISLSKPLQAPLTEAHARESQAALGAVAPFEMQYGPLRSFRPYPGVAYSIQPEDKFRQLRAVVHSTSIFAGMALKRQDIAPHMTIAEFITMERTHELLKNCKGKPRKGHSDATQSSMLCRIMPSPLSL